MPISSNKSIPNKASKEPVQLIRIPIKIGNIETLALVDSGSSASFLNPFILAQLNELKIQKVDDNSLNFYNASRSLMKTYGCYKLLYTYFNIF